MSLIWLPTSSLMILVAATLWLDWTSSKSAQVRPEAFPPLHRSSSSSYNTDPPPLSPCLGQSRDTGTNFSPLPSSCHWLLPQFPSRDHQRFQHLRSVLLAEECPSALAASQLSPLSGFLPIFSACHHHPVEEPAASIAGKQLPGTGDWWQLPEGAGNPNRGPEAVEDSLSDAAS